VKAQLDLLSNLGRLLEVTEFENDKRKEMNLPPVQEKTRDVKIILEKLGFHREEKTEG
jgi:hypothetical protein